MEFSWNCRKIIVDSTDCITSPFLYRISFFCIQWLGSFLFGSFLWKFSSAYILTRQVWSCEPLKLSRTTPTVLSRNNSLPKCLCSGCRWQKTELTEIELADSEQSSLSLSNQYIKITCFLYIYISADLRVRSRIFNVNIHTLIHNNNKKEFLQ